MSDGENIVLGLDGAEDGELVAECRRRGLHAVARPELRDMSREELLGALNGVDAHLLADVVYDLSEVCDRWIELLEEAEYTVHNPGETCAASPERVLDLLDQRCRSVEVVDFVRMVLEYGETQARALIHGRHEAERAYHANGHGANGQVRGALA